MRKILIAAAAIAIAGAGVSAALWAFGALVAPAGKSAAPKLAALPPLPQGSRPTTVVAPVAITFAAIRDALEAKAPKTFTGKSDRAIEKVLDKLVVETTISRGPLAISGQQQAMTVTAPLDGTVHASGQLGAEASKVTSALGNLLGGKLGKDVSDFGTKPFDQRTALKGSATMTVRPTLTANWRIDPHLSGSADLGDIAVNIAGAKVDLTNDARPVIASAVNREIARLEERLRNDATIEQEARAQWQRMCRAIPLGSAAAGMPPLWLELKPAKAFAAQPKIDGNAVFLTLGIEAATRVVPNETKPDCPFPAQLDLTPPVEAGKLAVGVPIDLPLAALSKLLDAQLKGRKFPEGGAAPVEIEVKAASLAASGDRLLISLDVTGTEKKSWFGLGADATIYIWGKPALDQAKQTLRFTDLSLAVESDAAFGLLGAAARAAIPYLEEELAQNAVVDLKPLISDARKNIDAALADFRQPQPGVEVLATVDDLRLAGIAFDSTTLRVIGEASGTAAVTIRKLPAL
jgi:hypothetical protein